MDDLIRHKEITVKKQLQAFAKEFNYTYSESNRGTPAVSIKVDCFTCEGRAEYKMSEIKFTLTLVWSNPKPISVRKIWVGTLTGRSHRFIGDPIISELPGTKSTFIKQTLLGRFENLEGALNKISKNISRADFCKSEKLEDQKSVPC